ncbi:MAG TPA: cyclic nucleotide-binding domain-containing protein [Stellaceae bacterium]|nr:cyclic nucleotide-binding domain-containing protein [Stellaceae bacterium]
MSWIDLLGYAASLAVFATFCMQTMVPLRVVALGSNVLFSCYGYFGHVYPVMILHLVLFPINVIRLTQVHRLVRTTRSASAAGLSMDNVLPFMRRRALAAGETVFRKGDFADRLYYIGSGNLEIKELGIELSAKDVFGEIGIFAPDHRRTETVVCVTDCELFELAEDKAKELYFQNPSFGYAVIRLIIMRLLENSRRVAGAG